MAALLWVGLGLVAALVVFKAGVWCARRYRAASRTLDVLLDLSERDAPLARDADHRESGGLRDVGCAVAGVAGEVQRDA